MSTKKNPLASNNPSPRSIEVMSKFFSSKILDEVSNNDMNPNWSSKSLILVPGIAVLTICTIQDISFILCTAFTPFIIILSINEGIHMSLKAQITPSQGIEML
eukprot:TRINITY_DN10403_c1_g1_i2.p1 TRINITY_DN10403_c1_g1~~TRINITY_DN10403_c1_g1_i2.p1  ORF type:complete len:103 (+),score=3.62 TRINITY_DN10403_c1_g1_i2:1946-2254(+)